MYVLVGRRDMKQFLLGLFCALAFAHGAQVAQVCDLPVDDATIGLVKK